jgi:hypothetical protein
MSATAKAGHTPDTLRALGHQPEPVLRAIRRKCLDCSGGSHAEAADCLLRSCALFPFRFGRNPWRAPASEARREAGRRIAASSKKAGTNPAFAATDGLAATTLPAPHRCDEIRCGYVSDPVKNGEETGKRIDGPKP